jgi:hypothetical protein
MGGTPVRSSDNSLLLPPKALPLSSVRAAATHHGRDSLTPPMLGVQAKSNGMSALLDSPERRLDPISNHETDIRRHLCIDFIPTNVERL